MKGRLYNSLTSLVLVLTLLSRLTISLTCQQLIAVSKNSAILGSWNTSVMNQTFSFILLFLFVPITAFPFCLYPAAFISSTKSCAPAAQHSWASAHGRLSSCPAILWLHPSLLDDLCHLEDSREELLQKPWNATLRINFKAAFNCKQSATDFKCDFVAAAAASHISTSGMCSSVCISERSSQKDQQLSITSIIHHCFYVNMVWPLAHTDPKLFLLLFTSYLTAELRDRVGVKSLVINYESLCLHIEQICLKVSS